MVGDDVVVRILYNMMNLYIYGVSLLMFVHILIQLIGEDGDNCLLAAAVSIGNPYGNNM